MAAEDQERVARFAVLSRKIVFVAAIALMVTGALLLSGGRTGPGITLIVVAALLALARALWTLVRGARVVAARQKAEVPDAPAVAAGTASPVERVVADLVGMNAEGLPYLIEATPGPGAVQVEVRWKVEELRWQTLFVRGRVAYAWRMELTLDRARSQYRFTEYSGKADAKAVIGPGGGYARASWNWHRGKTSHQTSMTVVEGSDGQIMTVGSTEPRTSWEGVASIHPSDAKKPIFTVLRQHGWRPRFDWFGARMFEK
jgi:hypothetical protein